MPVLVGIFFLALAAGIFYIWFQWAQFFLNWLPTVQDVPSWFNVHNFFAYVALLFLLMLAGTVLKIAAKILHAIFMIPFGLIAGLSKSIVPAVFGVGLWIIGAVVAAVILTKDFLGWTDKNEQFTTWFQPEHWYAWVVVFLAIIGMLLPSSKKDSDDR